MNATGTFFSVLLAHWIYHNDHFSHAKIWGLRVGFAGVMLGQPGRGNARPGLHPAGRGLCGDCRLCAGRCQHLRQAGVAAHGFDGHDRLATGLGGAALLAIGWAWGARPPASPWQSTLLLVYLALLSSAAFSPLEPATQTQPGQPGHGVQLRCQVFGAVLSAIFLARRCWSGRTCSPWKLVCVGIWLVTRDAPPRPQEWRRCFALPRQRANAQPGPLCVLGRALNWAIHPFTRSVSTRAERPAHRSVHPARCGWFAGGGEQPWCAPGAGRARRQGGLVDGPCYDSLQGYLEGQLSMGAFIGRASRRLRAGSCMPGGCTPQLPTNSGPHHHHGGPQGSRFQVFGVTEVQPDAMVLTHTFRTEDDGVPGTVRLTLHLQVTLTTRCTWTGWLRWPTPPPCSTPQATPFQPGGRGSTLGHTLQVPASRHVPLAPMCPTGTVDSVQGTPSTFASRAAWPMPRPRCTSSWHGPVGWTTTWCWTMPPSLCSPAATTGLRLAAQLADPASGRAMQVWEHRPGVGVRRPRPAGRPGPRPGAGARAGHLAVAARRRHLPGAHGVPRCAQPPGLPGGGGCWRRGARQHRVPVHGP